MDLSLPAVILLGCGIGGVAKEALHLLREWAQWLMR